MFDLRVASQWQDTLTVASQWQGTLTVASQSNMIPYRQKEGRTQGIKELERCCEEIQHGDSAGTFIGGLHEFLFNFCF